jgi:hypothetical protein
VALLVAGVDDVEERTGGVAVVDGEQADVVDDEQQPLARRARSFVTTSMAMMSTRSPRQTVGSIPFSVKRG